MSTLSTPYKHLQRRAEREDDAALSSYNDSLAAALIAEHTETSAAAKASRLAAGAAARSEMQRRALAAKRARALDVAAAGQSAPPWAWLPALPAHLPAAAMSHTLSSSLQRSPHYHPSNCDTMLGEVGACPLIVQAQRKEAARELAVGAWEAGLQGRAEAEDAAAFAGAAAAREALLDAVAASEREGRRAEQQQLAATREKERLDKQRAAEREEEWHRQALAKAAAEADRAVGAAGRGLGFFSPSKAEVRQGYREQMAEKEVLGGIERQWHRDAEQSMLGFSAAARMIA